MALDSKSGTNVVIKVYHKSKMQPKHHHKLAREIEIMERMNGAYCTELFGTFSNNDSICLVMVRAACYIFVWDISAIFDPMFKPEDIMGSFDDSRSTAREVTCSSP